jgi:hypothetical protein
MSLIWKYFYKSAGKAFCKKCKYDKDFPAQASPTILVQHLKKHDDLYKEYLTLKEAQNKEKTQMTTKQTTQMSIKRSFDQSAAGSPSTSSASDPITLDEAGPIKQPRIEIALHAISLFSYKHYNQKE